MSGNNIGCCFETEGLIVSLEILEISQVGQRGWRQPKSVHEKKNTAAIKYSGCVDRLRTSCIPGR